MAVALGDMTGSPCRRCLRRMFVSRNTGGIYWLVFFRSASRAIVSSVAACSASGDRAGCSLLSTPAVRATTLVARARRTWSASTTNATLSWGAMPSSFRTTMGVVTWPLLVTLAICWRAGIGLRIGNTLITMIITLIASSLRSVNRYRFKGGRGRTSVTGGAPVLYLSDVRLRRSARGGSRPRPCGAGPPGHGPSRRLVGHQPAPLPPANANPETDPRNYEQRPRHECVRV